MANDGFGRPGADGGNSPFYLRGDKVCRIAFKAPLVGRIFRPHQPGQDANSILPAGFDVLIG